jgi:MoxR-like ATPase
MATLLLNRLIHGYEELEPVILGLMAMDKSFILIGRHGTGKTKMAKWLSHGFGDGSFVFYDATKDDLISIAGIPDPESIKVGKLRFVGHERSIWDKSVIVVDEITRAAKENQNLWLEILEERTCFGIPLKYRSIIATANPESYAAAFQLDEALLDRFYAVIPVPEMQSAIDSYDIKMMVDLSLRDGENVGHDEIIKIFGEIKDAHASLIKEKAMDKVAAYLGEIIPPMLAMFQEQNNLYMSPRTYCHILPEAIMAIAAYYKVIGSPEPLQDGAVQALRYSVATKLQTNPLAIEQHHRSAAVILKGGNIPGNEKLKLDINSIKNVGELLSYLEVNWSAILVGFSEDEMEKTIKKIYKDVIKNKNNRDLLRLQSTLINVGYDGDTLRQIKGQLGTSVFKARRKLLPVIQQYLLSDNRAKKISNDLLEKLQLFESVLKDSQFLTADAPDVIEVMSLILMINDKYDKPLIDDILAELKGIKIHAVKEQ